MTELLLLEDGRHRVAIAPELGGGIAAFDAVLDDRLVPVLRPWGGVETGPFGLACNLLVPFSNRISGGGFSHGEVFHPVEPNLGGEPLPIHGDGFQKPWRVDEADARRATLSLPVGEIGPFRYQGEARYALAGEGLSCRLAMTNAGDGPLPFGGGFHPWFPRHADTTLSFRADRVWTEDDRHLPRDHVDLSDRPEWDFTVPRRLPADWINNAFTGWDGRATIGQPGLGIMVSLAAADPLRTAIVYSPDDRASFFCFEPVSHAVDAINMDGRPGLLDLSAGETLTLDMTIAWAPLDGITVGEIAQTGASCVVTALHEIPYGEVWTIDRIEERKALVEQGSPCGLSWDVVESLPVHEDIKHGTGDLPRLFANYRQSLANLAACSIRTVCYNFMAILDWTRTDDAFPVDGGGAAMAYSAPRMAAFEIFMLEREGAEQDYPEAVREAAAAWFEQSSAEDRDALLAIIMAGLPGAYDRYDVAGLRAALDRYRGFRKADLRANYARFLSEVVPAAEELGVRLCVHPDDPPRDLFGLPRIVSSEDDIGWVLGQQDSRANGLTFCSGALGANPECDLPATLARFADRIHFLHLRNVRKSPDGSFFEDAHLGGDTDMVQLISLVLDEEDRRRAAGRDDASIPFRPDHGHKLLSDFGRDTHPGYPLIGRMRGLAELRGVIAAVSRLRKAEV